MCIRDRFIAYEFVKDDEEYYIREDPYELYKVDDNYYIIDVYKRQVSE